MKPEELINAPRVAIIARTERQRRYFAELMAPYDVQFVADDVLQSCRAEELNRSIADVLLVDLEEGATEGDLDVDLLIDQAQLPILFNDGDADKRHTPTSIAGKAWGRRLADKLTALADSTPAAEVKVAAAPLKLVTSDLSPTDFSAELGFDLHEALIDGDDFDLTGSADAESELPQMPAQEAYARADTEAACEFDFEPPAEMSLQDLPLLSEELTDSETLGFKSAPEDWTISDEFTLEEVPTLLEAAEPLKEWTLASATDAVGEPEVFIAAAQTSDRDVDPLAAAASIADAEPLSNELLFDSVMPLSEERALADQESILESLSDFDETAKTTDSFEQIESESQVTVPVWVLGASIGGPQAVKEFIAELPKDINAAFIVAQHIGNGFVDLLASQLDRLTELEVCPAQSGMRLRPGQIVVAPVEQRLAFTNGIIALQPAGRKSVYSPCIDDVMTEVAHAFKGNVHAIIFSGMGNDGVEGARAIVAAGGSVWGQAASTCVISSMADAARDAGLVSETGTPAELARRLLRTLNGET